MAKKSSNISEFVAMVAPCYDFNRHTILRVMQSDNFVKFIPLDIVEGLKIKTSGVKEFNSMYKEIPDYTIEKACGLFVNYARTLGATKEVMDILCTFSHVSAEDIELAMGKRKVTEDSKLIPEKKPPAPKKESVNKTKDVIIKTKAEPKSSKSEAAKPLENGKARQSSAAEMFRDLIMEGKLTDDQIFKEVQDAFGIDDSKKSYVNWYRKKLEKDGKKPPKPVVKK